MPSRNQHLVRRSFAQAGHQNIIWKDLGSIQGQWPKGKLRNKWRHEKGATYKALRRFQQFQQHDTPRGFGILYKLSQEKWRVGSWQPRNWHQILRMKAQDLWFQSLIKFREDKKGIILLNVKVKIGERSKKKIKQRLKKENWDINRTWESRRKMNKLIKINYWKEWVR